MAMSRPEKEQAVAAYKERFEEDEILVIVQNQGLTVAEMTELRLSIRNEGASFKVMKNKLAQRALEGTKFEGVANMFSGPTGVASSKEPSVAKAVQKFAKDHKKLVIVGGAMGAIQLDAAGVEQLSKLPSLDELRSKLIGLIQAPATKVAGVLQAPAGQLARIMGAQGAKTE